MSQTPEAMTPTDTEETQAAARHQARERMLDELGHHLAHSPEFIGHLMSTLLNSPQFVMALGDRMTQLQREAAAINALPVQLHDAEPEYCAMMVQRVPLNAPERAGEAIYYTRIKQQVENQPEPVESWAPAPEGFRVPANVHAEVTRAIDAGEFEAGHLKYVDFVCPPEETSNDDQ